MRISINLATRPFADIGPMIKRLRIAMGVLAVLGIALGFGLHALHNKAEAARAREHSLDGAIARINGERQGYQFMMSQPDNATVLSQSQNLNRLFDEKAFSWTLAMEDLETVLPGGVQVTTLEPLRDKTGRITLRLRVVGPRNADVGLLQNLEHSRQFLEPRIVGESAETNGAPGAALEPVSASNRVTFEVLADYNPATLGELARKTAEAKAEKKTSVPHPATPAKHTGAVTPALQHSMGTRPAGPGARAPFSGVSRPPQTIAKPRPGAPSAAPNGVPTGAPK